MLWVAHAVCMLRGGGWLNQCTAETEKKAAFGYGGNIHHLSTDDGEERAHQSRLQFRYALMHSTTACRHQDAPSLPLPLLMLLGLGSLFPRPYLHPLPLPSSAPLLSPNKTFVNPCMPV